jgi:NAD(P)H-dependent FMN reductase
MKIQIIAGSPRSNSITFRLALFLQEYFSQNTTHEVGLIDAKEWDLPLLQSIFNSIENTPEEYRSLSEKMFGADAFILVSPEYNGSYSPALKNLLDHYPKQHHKPFAVATASPGGLGGIRAALQMQLLVMALFGICSPYMLVVPQVDKKFDEEGNLVEQSFLNAVHNFVGEFLWLAENLKPAEAVH